MAVGHFEVDTDFLRRIVEELRQDLQSFQKNKDEIDAEMANVKAMWEGPAKETFFTQYSTDITEYDDFCIKLQAAIEAVAEALREYEASDGRARSVVDAIKV